MLCFDGGIQRSPGAVRFPHGRTRLTEFWEDSGALSGALVVSGLIGFVGRWTFLSEGKNQSRTEGYCLCQ